MSADVVALRPESDAAAAALAAAERDLDRSKLSPHTKRAYRRHLHAYLTWLAGQPGRHPDAWHDAIGAEAAVTAWRRHLLTERYAPSTVNQALAAVDLLYEHGAGMRIKVDRLRVPKPGDPDALEPAEQDRVERAARRRGSRDRALIVVLLYCGARVEECARIDTGDLVVTERTGTLRLHGKGDEVREVPVPQEARKALRAWLDDRGRDPGPLWLGQRGRLTVSGITQAILAVGVDADLPGLRPHRLRHTYATRLRQGGADAAQIQALLGHALVETSARYFRAGAKEQAAVVERIFGHE